MKRILLVFMAVLMMLGTCAQADDKTIDFDLSTMNPAMSYTIAVQINEYPSFYAGKRIKMQGYYEASRNPKTGEMDYAIVVVDMASCCFSDGCYTIGVKIDDDNAFEMPAIAKNDHEMQLFELSGTVVVEKNGKTEICYIHAESITPLDHYSGEIYWP